ncbi:hypothetical protein MHYP_G00081070 [Metynnis hypsauchen]
MYTVRKPNTTTVEVKIIIVNNLPMFQQKIQTACKKEEGNPGEVLYELVDDTAKWVKVDPKIGKITTSMKMDCESPYVVNGTYKVLIGAMDNGSESSVISLKSLPYGNYLVPLRIKDKDRGV